MPKILSISGDGLHISNEEVANKFKKKKISPSLIASLDGCHAKFAVSTYVMPELSEDEYEPDNPMSRGSLYHLVMEKLFALEPEERTAEAINMCCEEALATDEYAHFRSNPDAIAWLKKALRNYYMKIEDPTQVKIADIDGKKGLEIFVSETIGDSKRKCIGFIDRVTEDPDGDGIRVEDWKTGAKAKVWNPKTKSDDGLKEQRQQIMYFMMLEKKGYDVTAARLIYPIAETSVDVLLDDDELIRDTVEGVERTDKKLDVLTETNTFGFSPDFSCSFCPFAKMCPAASLKNHIKKNGEPSKLKLAYDGQPEASAFEGLIDFGGNE